MSYFRHGDPLDDFNALDMERAMYEERLPMCDDCKMKIVGDHYYDIEGEILCEDCMKDRYQRETEDFANHD